METAAEPEESGVDAVLVEDRWVVPCTDALDRDRGLTIKVAAHPGDTTVLGFPAGAAAIMSPGHARAVGLLVELAGENGPENEPDGSAGP